MTLFQPHDLEELCLYKIRTHIDQFQVSTLSLLPRHFRQRLICGLPAADVCKLENIPEFIEGVDVTSVWEMHFADLFLWYSHNWNAMYGPFLRPKNLLPSAKENFLVMIGMMLFLKRDSNNHNDEPLDWVKWLLISPLLFGFTSTSNDFLKQECSPVSFQLCTIYVPPRYADHLDDKLKNRIHVSEMISLVMEVFDNLGPMKLHVMLTGEEGIDDNLFAVDRQVLKCFLSRVEEYHIQFFYGYGHTKTIQSYCKLLRSTISSQLHEVHQNSVPQECSLHSLRLDGFHINLQWTLEYLKESCLFSYSSHHHGCDWRKPTITDRIPYTKLKKIELIANDHEGKLAGHYLEDCQHDLCCDLFAERFVDFRLDSYCDILGAILYSQEELEVVYLEEMSSIRFPKNGCYYMYTGFEELYFSLPLLISRPSFKSLTLKACSLPINAAQNIIRTFLCTPTTHTQHLDLSGCSLYDTQKVILPRGCPESPIIPDNSPCVDGNLKSLSLYVNNGRSNFAWLLNHPKMKLKYLELYCNPTAVDKKVKIPMYGCDDEEETTDERQEDEHQTTEIKSREEQTREHVEQICEFICKLEHPEKLDVHFISTSGFCSVGIKKVSLLPALANLTHKDSHWSLEY